MKRLLLSACIVGVVFAGTPHPPQSMQNPAVPQPVNVAWAASVPGGVSERAKSQYPGLQRVAFRSSAVGALQADGTPVASVDDLFAPVLSPAAAKAPAPAVASEAIDENAAWAVVIRGAWAHSGPSVSAPLTGHFSPGKELHLIDSQNGWYQVFDPATSQRGWILAKYYLEPIDRPGQKRVAVVQESQAPIQTAAAAEEAKPAPRRVTNNRVAAIQPARLENTRTRGPAWGEGVASVLDRALRR